MAFVPALIPLGVSLGKIHRNTSDDDSQTIVPHKDRGRAIINKMIKGGASAPITEWSEAKLERAIRRNSMFRDHASELRLARVNCLQLAQGKSKIARTLSQDLSLGQADLLLLAAEEQETRPNNPARDVALELLADNSFDAILITDPGGNIVYSNKAFTKLTGYEQADVIGKSPKLLQGPGTDMKVLARLKQSMHNEDGDYEGSAINYKKNGTPFIMHWRVVPVKVGGEVQAWVAIQREGVAVE